MKKIGKSEVCTSLRPGRPRVLYVEDNDDNWSVAEMRLGKIYNLIRAANDREACALLKKHGGEFYVVLMDIELQGSLLDGVALTKLIRGRLPEAEMQSYARGVPTSEVPVVFVTAYHTSLTKTLDAAGGNLVTPKPVEFMKLLRDLTQMHLHGIERPTPGRPSKF